MTRQSKTLLLDPSDAAFVLRADGRQQMFIPDGAAEASVPEHVLEATMLGFVLKDPETRAMVKARWKRVLRVRQVAN